MAESPKEMKIDVAIDFTPMAEMATGLHELFMSYVDAGFTRPEALSIVLHMMSTFGGND